MESDDLFYCQCLNVFLVVLGSFHLTSGFSFVSVDIFDVSKLSLPWFYFASQYISLESQLGE